jgi:dinuclear metal center YbgI/SA1388 family protein
MLCKDLDRLFRDILTIDELAHVDSSLNGIQVGDENKEIKKIAFAVDASVESFHRASEQEADMLFVHHGLLWSKQKTITGNLYKRIKLLIEADIVLYAVHLPLDKDPELGNNIGIARSLGLEDLEVFGMYKGIKIGWKGKLPAPLSLEEIKGKLLTKGEKGLGVLPFGPEPIQSIGIVSGGDPRSGLQAIDEGLDLFITGDASHELYHEALEGHLNVIFAGHYATEVWGIRQVAEKVKTMTECDVVMLDIPTGL